MRPLPAWLFRIALLLSLGGMVAHELVGAPMVLRPLEQSSLATDVVWLHHFSWHVGSIMVLGIAALFHLAVRQHNWVMAAVATGMCAGLGALGVSLAIWGNGALWTTPAPYVWNIIAAVGVLGLWLSRDLLTEGVNN